VTVTIDKKSPTVAASVTPASPNIYTPVSLVCNVTNGQSGPSTVTFTYTLPGASTPTTSSAQTLSSGSASLSLGTLTAGTLANVKCTSAADTNNLSVASNTVLSTTVAGIDPNRVTKQYIDVTVVPGTLTLTVKGVAVGTSAKTGTQVSSPGSYVAATDYSTNVVVLPDASVNAAGTYIETSGKMLPVQVVDTRSGDAGYSVTGQLDSLVQPSGATHPGDTINGQNFGWTPSFIQNSRDTTKLTAAAAGLTDGGVVNPANGVSSSASGSLGLAGTAKTLFTAPAGFGLGTTIYGATLNMKAPTTTRDGLYEGTLVLTAA
jgi:hypothetical protein